MSFKVAAPTFIMIHLEIKQVCISRFKCRRTPYSANVQFHWREQAAWAKAWKDMVNWEARGQRPVLPFKKAKVTIFLYHVRLFDKDNAYFSVKHLVDGLKDIIIVDDSPHHIELVVEQVKVAHRVDEKVVIQIEET